MNKYVIVNVVYAEELLPEIHDLEMENIAARCEALRSAAACEGVQIFFRETTNDRAVGESFALVEHNFDMSADQKQAFARALAPFFEDGTLTGDTITPQNDLSAVCFSRLDGDVIRIR